MSGLKPASGTLRTALAPCFASSSRLTPRRCYAQETELTSQAVHVEGLSPVRKEQPVLRRFKGKGFPKTNSLQHVVKVFHPHLWRGGPFKDLTVAHRRSGGRGDTGQIITRHIGGGHKRRLRTVDFHRRVGGVHDVIRIEYDPGRSAHIALIRSRGGSKVSAEEGAKLAEAEELPLPGKPAGSGQGAEVRGGWSYILAPEGLRAGDVVSSYRSGIPQNYVEGWDSLSLSSAGEKSTQADVFANTRAIGLLRAKTIKPGNCLPLYLIPPGTQIHNIALEPMGKMRLCRSAGSFGTVVAHNLDSGESLSAAEVLQLGGWTSDGKVTKKNGWALVKLRSGEVRKVHPGCVATVGSVSNKEHNQAVLGKAGASRHRGRRPRVRGVAMNTVDHPMGGGRGKGKGGKHSTSIYGKVTKGVKTRRPSSRGGNKMVVTERPRGYGPRKSRKGRTSRQ